MTAKAKVLAVHPKAFARRMRTNGRSSYVLIYQDRQVVNYLASGKNTTEAWSKAAKKI